VNHRHLLPEEFDLLLDDEVGFGVAPLREHVQGCAACRAQLEDARLVASALESLPHFSPSFTLSDKVMSQVPVFVPWHTAARDGIARFMPQSRPGQVAAGALMAAGAGALTGGAVWLATRGDMVSFASEFATAHLRGMVTNALQSTAVTLFGPGVLETLQHGSVAGLSAIAGGFVLAATASAFGLRAIAHAAQRRS
jgi:hypothetical protein